VGDLAGRPALVAGGAQGIGRGIVEALVREGAPVVIMDLDGGLASSVARELRSAGPPVVATGGDVTSRADVRAAVELCVGRFGGLAVAVANAGTVAVEPITEIGDATWHRILEVNLTGAFHCVQEAARVMVPARAGSIVVTASTNAFWMETNLAHYNASKAGVVALVRSAALELAPYGVRVNAVGPGLVRTRLTRFITEDPGRAADFLRQIPLGRFGEPADVAEAVVFLASDRASWITGEHLVVDGGQTLGTPVPLPGPDLPGPPVPGGEG
jgi:3-oxoacyl-[acyl-carrier protein] reductase